MGDESLSQALDGVLTDLRRIAEAHAAPPADVQLPASVRSSAAIYKARRLRDRLFGENLGLFGEPAWDILLDLHSHSSQGRRVSITDACAAAAVPATTGLRYVGWLEEAGLIERRTDPSDKRRSWLELSWQGRVTLEKWLAEVQ